MPRESLDAPENLPKERRRQGALGQLEDEVAGMSDEAPAGLEQPLLEAMSPTTMGARARRMTLPQRESRTALPAGTWAHSGRRSPGRHRTRRCVVRREVLDGSEGALGAANPLIEHPAQAHQHELRFERSTSRTRSTIRWEQCKTLLSARHLGQGPAAAGNQVPQRSSRLSQSC